MRSEELATDSLGVEELWTATEELSERGLYQASRWLAELLVAVIDRGRPDAGTPSLTRQHADPVYCLAKRFYDCRELDECARLLTNRKDPKSVWLRSYTRYLIILREQGTDPQVTESRRTRTPVDTKQMSELLAQIGSSNDPFLLYLRSLILSNLGQKYAAVLALHESLNCYPYNWSAWLHLTRLLDGEEELIALLPRLPIHYMTRFFHVNATLEVHRASDELRASIDALARSFPGCIHLRAQRALLEYHMRDFDLAEKLFDEISEDYPNRLDDIDTYSNILYVMGKRAKLSQVAHKYAKIDRDRPETCCLIGNFYSLRGEHAKAIAYFRRAIKLDSTYLAAWTLMGHEYVELSNTHAAIEAYRQACSANSKDYRAWYGLGQAYELLNMHVYALRYYQRSTALRPFDSRMWGALGNCYARMSKPHEVLKCLKRAQLFAEPDDTSVLRKLGDHCLSMQLLPEAALYWTRLVEVAQTHGIPQIEYTSVLNLLAAYEMGEHHIANRKKRVIGDLALAEVYLKKVLESNGDDVDYAKRLHQSLRVLQL